MVVLAGCVFVALFLHFRSSPRAETPVRAVDLYVTALQRGDRGAMADILDGNAALRAKRLSEVDGRPVNVTAVSITRSPDFDVLYNVAVTWMDGTHGPSTDRLLVLPAQAHPNVSLGWSVSVAQ